MIEIITETEIQKIYEEECKAVSKKAKDKIAELLRQRIQHLKKQLEVSEDWLKSNGYLTSQQSY